MSWDSWDDMMHLTKIGIEWEYHDELWTIVTFHVYSFFGIRNNNDIGTL